MSACGVSPSSSYGGDDAHLPCGKDARGFGQVEARGRVVVVKASDEARDAERPDSSRLGVALRRAHSGQLPDSPSQNRVRTGARTYLLDSSNVPRDVLDRDGVLDRQPVRLALCPCAVDQDARVGGETGEPEADVVVEHGGFPDRSRVLELEDRFLFDGEDDAVFAADSDGASSLADGFEGIVDLEQVAVGAVRRRRRQRAGGVVE